MAREIFVDKRFQQASVDIIDKANVILEEYERQGLVLTLRQLYYQFVARGLLPNKQTEYKRLGSIISDARLAGLIDWTMMEDRTRHLRKMSEWSNPAQIIEAVASQYREDLWRTQKWRPEVWIEKDALVGVIEGVCNELRIPYFACRGYSSQSAQYEAGLRFRSYKKDGQDPVVFHFGDHDPSGIDMSRDNTDRLSMFTGSKVRVVRLALTQAQIAQYNPPPNPAKETDSRAAEYMALYGNQSWELDALEPSVIGQLIRNAAGSIRDGIAWKKAKKKEDTNKADLAAVSDQWDVVRQFVHSL